MLNMRILKSRIDAGDNWTVRILDDVPKGPIYWSDEYETKPAPDPVIRHHLAFKVNAIGTTQHKWFHLVVTLTEAARRVNGSLLSRLPKDMSYIADSIIDLTDGKYIKNRSSGVGNEDADEDLVEFLMDWPVTEIHNLYHEMEALTGRKIWGGKINV